jgi:hypothetical protein
MLSKCIRFSLYLDTPGRSRRASLAQLAAPGQSIAGVARHHIAHTTLGIAREKAVKARADAIRRRRGTFAPQHQLMPILSIYNTST